MKTIIYSILCFILFISCSERFFVNNQYVIKRIKGIALFTDKESKNFRNLGQGDVFTDSLLPDFFIPFNFDKPIVQKKIIETALFSNLTPKGHFFYLQGDCNEEQRTALINAESLKLDLDKNVDNYLASNKTYILPVELNYLEVNINKEYYNLHRFLEIEFNHKTIKILFEPGYLQVLKLNVLQYDWNN